MKKKYKYVVRSENASGYLEQKTNVRLNKYRMKRISQYLNLFDDKVKTVSLRSNKTGRILETYSPRTQ